VSAGVVRSPGPTPPALRATPPWQGGNQNRMILLKLMSRPTISRLVLRSSVPSLHPLELRRDVHGLLVDRQVAVALYRAAPGRQNHAGVDDRRATERPVSGFGGSRGSRQAGQSPSVEDRRFDYGEPRFITLGLLNGEVVVVVTTETDQDIRVISMQKAKPNEQAIYFRNVGG
jgi:hypothetical protein